MRVIMSVSVEPELAHAVEAFAQQRRWAVNKVLNEALKQLLSRERLSEGSNGRSGERSHQEH